MNDRHIEVDHNSLTHWNGLANSLAVLSRNCFKDFSGHPTSLTHPIYKRLGCKGWPPLDRGPVQLGKGRVRTDDKTRLRNCLGKGLVGCNKSKDNMVDLRKGEKVKKGIPKESEVVRCDLVPKPSPNILSTCVASRLNLKLDI